MTGVPILRRNLELASPYPEPRGLRLLLGRNVVAGILPVSDGLALADHPLIEVDATFGAYRDHAAVFVSVALIAGHDVVRDPVGEGKRSFLPTAIGYAIACAGL